MVVKGRHAVCQDVRADSVTFERWSSTAHSGYGSASAAWALDFDTQRDQSYGFHSARDTKLVFGFFSRRTMAREAAAEVWIEKRQRQTFVTININGEDIPKTKQKMDFRDVFAEVANTRRPLKLAGLEYVIAEALADNEIVGKSASTAVYQFYWTHFIDDDEGLSYLHKKLRGVGADNCIFQRLNFYTRRNQGSSRDQPDDQHLAENIGVAYDAIKEVDRQLGAAQSISDRLSAPFYCAALVDRIHNDLVDYPTMCAAIAAIQAAADVDDEQRRQLVVDCMLHEAAPDDHAFAMIIAATDKHPMLGLRACQRVACGDTLRDRLADLRAAGGNVHHTLKLLRDVFKGQTL